MKLAATTGLALLLAVSFASVHPLSRVAADGAANQIRLDRPVGGGGGGDGGAPASPPPPPSGMLMDVSVEDTLRLMRGLKYSSVTIEKGKNSPYIKAVIDDQPTYVWHANCTGNRCRALHFAAYLGKQDSVDDAFIHDYNRNTMFTKMAKDSDGDLQVTMGVSLARGVSEDHIRAMADGWIIYFKEALEYKPEGK